MNRRAMILSITLLMVSAAAGAGRAASTSPGKNAAFESATINPIPVPPATLLTATILKGKKRTVLAVEAMLTASAGPALKFTIRPTVNGVDMEPQGAASQEGCSASIPCSATGTWWLDLDAAETANPGTFISQPLTITLIGGEQSGAAIDGHVTMTARLQKK